MCHYNVLQSFLVYACSLGAPHCAVVLTLLQLLPSSFLCVLKLVVSPCVSNGGGATRTPWDGRVARAGHGWAQPTWGGQAVALAVPMQRLFHARREVGAWQC